MRINVSEEDQARERNSGEEERGGDGAPEVDGFGLPKHVGGGITGGEEVRRRPLAARERSWWRRSAITMKPALRRALEALSEMSWGMGGSWGGFLLEVERIAEEMAMIPRAIEAER